MKYKFIEGFALADIAFEARGKSLEDMFQASAEALTNSMISKLQSIEGKKEIKFKVEAEIHDRLLHNFLQELIFYKDAKLLLFNEYKIKIEEKPKTGKLVLHASVKGEKIDMKKHELLVDVKAVSWHMFKVEKTKSGWYAFVILDV